MFTGGNRLLPSPSWRCTPRSAFRFAGMAILFTKALAAPSLCSYSVSAQAPASPSFVGASPLHAAAGSACASLLMTCMGKQHEKNAQMETTHVRRCLSTSRRQPQMRVCGSRMHVHLMLLALQQNGSGGSGCGYLDCNRGGRGGGRVCGDNDRVFHCPTFQCFVGGS